MFIRARLSEMGLWVFFLACLWQIPVAYAQPGGIKEIIAYRQARPLAGHQTWTLRNGWNVEGAVFESMTEGYFKLEKRGGSSSPSDSATYFLPLEMFRPEDQQSVLAAHKRGYHHVRYQYLPSLARSVDNWKGEPPPNARRFANPVAVEGGKVFSFSRGRLRAVEASAIADSELETLTRRFQQLGGGEHLVIDQWVPQTVLGRVLQETEQEFVLVVGPHPERSEFPLPEGVHYRLPKYQIGFVLEKELHAILKRAKNMGNARSFSEAELAAMPVARRDRRGWFFCYEPEKPSQQTIEFFVKPDERRQSESYRLACRDLLQVEIDALQRNGGGESGELRDKALLWVAESAYDREFWDLQPGNVVLQASLIGPWENGFVFQYINGEYLFVDASQLAPVDRKVAWIASQSDDFSWLTNDVITSVLTHRVIVKQSSASVVRIVGMTDEAPGIDQRTAKLTYTYDQEVDWWYHHLDHLDSVTRSVEMQQQVATLLADGSIDSARQKLASRLQPPAMEVPDLSSRTAAERSQRWFLGEQGEHIDATLIGKWDSDLIFVLDNDPTKTPFLLPRQDISSQHEAELKRIEDRLPDRDWKHELAMTRDGQFFRLWFNSDTGKLRNQHPGAIVGFKANKPLPGQVTVTLKEPSGRTVSLAFVARAEANQASGFSEFQRRWEEGQKRVAQMQQGFPEWGFRWHSETLRAEPLAMRGDDVVMQDFQEVIFLVRLATLDDDARQKIEMASLKQLDPATPPPESATVQPEGDATEDEAKQWLRLLSTQAGLYGPVVIREARFDTDDTLVVRSLQGAIERLPTSMLTLREGRILYAEQLRKRESLEDDRAIDRLLQRPISVNEQVKQTPPLEDALRQRIERSVEANQQKIVWETSPLEIEPEATLVAIDRSGGSGVVQMEDGKFHRVDLSTGQTRESGDLPGRYQFGPWMHDGSQKVWWVDGGKLMVGDGDQARALTIPETNEEVVAADQSGDFESLVLQLADGHQYRWDLAGGTATRLTQRVKRSQPDQPPRLIASPDGWSLVKLTEKSVSTLAFASGEDAHGNFLGMIGLETSHAAAGQGYALLSETDAPRGSLLWNRFGLRPTTVRLPVVPQRLEMVRIEDRDCVQIMGRPLDHRFENAGYTFVQWYDPNAGYGRYKFQILRGEIDADSLLGANGKVIVHRRNGKHVLSRRPESLVEPTERVIDSIAETLVDSLDIGQIEAVSDFLSTPAMREHGAYSGALADQFYRAINHSVFSFMPHLGGDPIDRSYDVARHFVAKYPESQVARCTLANWHNSIAWTARGSGYADSVTAKGWEIFRHHVRQGIEEVKPLAEVDDPISQVFHLRLSFAKSAGSSLDSLRQLAVDLSQSEHRKNASLHHQIAVYLLPRWHGQPGMVEQYLLNVADSIGGEQGDAVYAKSIELMKGMASQQGPVTFDHQWDMQRLVRGTKAYYRNRSDPALIDHMMALLAHHGHWTEMMDLLDLAVQRALLSPSIAILKTSTLTPEDLKADAAKGNERVPLEQ